MVSKRLWKHANTTISDKICYVTAILTKGDSKRKFYWLLYSVYSSQIYFFYVLYKWYKLWFLCHWFLRNMAQFIKYLYIWHRWMQQCGLTRETGRGGEVSLFRCTNIMCYESPEFNMLCEYIGCVFVKIKCMGYTTIFGVVYRPPNNNMAHFNDAIHGILEKVTGRPFYMYIIPMIHLLPIYFCTNSSWNVRAAICLEGRLSLLALSSVYSLTVEDGSWSTPVVPAQLSVPLQQVEE